jgi:hypothetical protein
MPDNGCFSRIVAFSLTVLHRRSDRDRASDATASVQTPVGRLPAVLHLLPLGRRVCAVPSLAAHVLSPRSRLLACLLYRVGDRADALRLGGAALVEADLAEVVAVELLGPREIS